MKKGYWIDEVIGRWIYAKCSVCGKVCNMKYNYCPDCGSLNGEVDECGRNCALRNDVCTDCKKKVSK